MKEYIVQAFARETIESFDAHNAPELIRCKDCKHWYFADNRIPSEQENICGRNGVVVTPDWYCADGERKSADEILMEEMDADPLG